MRLGKQLSISRAAYYKWLHREIPFQEQENIELANLVKEYDERFNHILGYRRMTSWINHFNHTNYSRKRVHRIMKKLNIHSVIRKKKKKYLSSIHRLLLKTSYKEILYDKSKMGNRCYRI